MGTKFSDIYNRFLLKITDDMYMELTAADTINDLQRLLINAIPGFEFPRIALNYSISTIVVDKSEVTDTDFILEEIDDNKVIIDNSTFSAELTPEEQNIIAILMFEGWIQRQVASVENTRMKYSGSDFKFTSQANYLNKLLALLAESQRQSLHMQRLYKRRKLTEDGRYVSNWSSMLNSSAIK